MKNLLSVLLLVAFAVSMIIFSLFLGDDNLRQDADDIKTGTQAHIKRAVEEIELDE